MDGKNRILHLSGTLGLLALNLIAANYLVAGWSTARLDLTEDRLFSISPVTERILQSLDESVIIHGYFSGRTHPKLAPLVPRIVDLLAEYRAVSGGRVQVEIFDPGTNEEAEQEASARFGVTSTPFQFASKYEAGIVNAYFALVIQHGDQYEKYGFEDLIEVEPLPDGDIEVKLRNLEYDLTRAIKKVVYGFRSATELFERVEGPVRFTALMSPQTLPEIFQDVPEAVRGAAAELEEDSGGRFIYEEIDPSGGDAQRQAVYARFGARPMSLGLFGGDSFYLYGILQVGEQVEQVSLTGNSLTQASVREAIEASLRRQTPGFLKTVGVVSPRPEIPPQLLMQYQMRGMAPPQPPPEYEHVKRFLGQDYHVQDVSLDGEQGVPAIVDVLVVLKPKDLSARAVFNLDQYLMRGGRLILCAGAYEADFSAEGLRVAPIDTGLDDWLGHMGIRLPRELVLDDRNQALPVPEVRRTPLGLIRAWRMAPYPYLVEVREDGLAGSEIGAGLEAIGIYWGNPVEVEEERTKELNVTDVLRSSERSWTSSDLTRVGFLDYQVPEEGTEPRTLAILLEGRFKSFFFDKEIPSATPAPGGEGVEPNPPSEVALEESPETRLLVVGNAEFLSDFVARVLGRTEGGFFAENLRFLENAIDWMTLDSDMIGIRSRAAVVRRLVQVGRGTEITLETINYLLPTLLLLSFATMRFLRRRNVAPLVRPAGSSTPANQLAEEVEQ